MSETKTDEQIVAEAQIRAAKDTIRKLLDDPAFTQFAFYGLKNNPGGDVSVSGVGTPLFFAGVSVMAAKRAATILPG